MPSLPKTIIPVARDVCFAQVQINIYQAGYEQNLINGLLGDNLVLFLRK